MKRIPEKYELDEADIKEAIALWLNQEHGDGTGYESDFKINFKTERKQGKIPPTQLIGGMSDYTYEEITAVAEKE